VLRHQSRAVVAGGEGDDAVSGPPEVTPVAANDPHCGLGRLGTAIDEKGPIEPVGQQRADPLGHQADWRVRAHAQVKVRQQGQLPLGRSDQRGMGVAAAGVHRRRHGVEVLAPVGVPHVTPDTGNQHQAFLSR